MTRTIKSFFGAGLLVAGILAVGLVSVAAQSSSQGTTLNLTVQSTISMTGLAASYSAPAPAGVVTFVNTGPITVATNDPLGYSLLISASSANFSSGPNSFALNDTIQICDVNVQNCVAGPQISTTPQVVFSTAAATGGDVHDVTHGIMVPDTAPGGVYSDSFTYTATAN